jgi:hypothetical protein
MNDRKSAGEEVLIGKAAARRSRGRKEHYLLGASKSDDRMCPHSSHYSVKRNAQSKENYV